MSNYRRLYFKGSTIFLTIVTYQRVPLFKNSDYITKLRIAVSQVKKEKPFDILGAVILPDHLHFIWSLPKHDSNYSQLISRMKVLFTRSIGRQLRSVNNIPESRRKHRESNVWQRRFWEHTIRNEQDLKTHLDYIHYNPVKHRLVSCPHHWEYSSFHQWVKRGFYPLEWGCCCHGKSTKTPDFSNIINQVGE
ncbi:REP-associated tyrosine transposase [Crocosphaera chwakensis]|uniref:Transposase IS200-like domain-containing protein n=1 Tax=Crocosphaera chwakensis CCY0110 TaxID=391612 RepID=A3ITP4_9CHRO|nr:transposase [Crocosphaera chwakensis]EAZ90110.1 hypothetical protein CY0110_05904 [Crocosphaera chwakensis CCY0110]